MANKKTNVIEVGFKKKVQPVRLGGLDFEIKTGTKYRNQYLEELPKMEEDLNTYQEDIKEASKNHDVNALKEAVAKTEATVKKCVDLVLGEGAFDQLMEVADDDVDVVLEAFSEMTDKYNALQTKKKANAYIEGKKQG